MARPREFDPKVALQDAMLLFWSNGYCDTSIDDLVKSTRVSRHGLYTTFGNKKEIFLASLDMYIDEMIVPRTAGMRTKSAGIDDVRAFFSHFIELAELNLDGPRGCFACNATAEFGLSDPDATQRIERVNELFRKSFRTALVQSQKKGEIPASVEVDQLSRALCASLLGLFITFRGNADFKHLKHTVQGILTMLDASISS